VKWQAASVSTASDITCKYSIFSANKHKCQVFMSCNVEDPTLHVGIEQCIKAHLEQTSRDWLQLT